MNPYAALEGLHPYAALERPNPSLALRARIGAEPARRLYPSPKRKRGVLRAYWALESLNPYAALEGLHPYAALERPNPSLALRARMDAEPARRLYPSPKRERGVLRAYGALGSLNPYAALEGLHPYAALERPNPSLALRARINTPRFPNGA